MRARWSSSTRARRRVTITCVNSHHSTARRDDRGDGVWTRARRLDARDDARDVRSRRLSLSRARRVHRDDVRGVGRDRRRWDDRARERRDDVAMATRRARERERRAETRAGVTERAREGVPRGEASTTGGERGGGEDETPKP